MGFFDFLFGNIKKAGEVVNNSDRGILHLKPWDIDALKQEFSVELYPADTLDIYDSYSQNGVNLEVKNESIRIIYDGMLAKNGAKDIYAVVGYGNNLKWEDVDVYLLQKMEGNIFEGIIPLKRQGNINIAFKDIDENWDNNAGMNYCFKNQFYH